MEAKKLRRSSNKMFLGVCAGLAEYFGIEPTIMRVIFALATILFPGSGIIAYVVLWLIMPEADAVPPATPSTPGS